MFYGIDINLQNILRIQTECGECSMKYCQFHVTLQWNLNNVMKLECRKVTNRSEVSILFLFVCAVENQGLC